MVDNKLTLSLDNCVYVAVITMAVMCRETVASAGSLTRISEKITETSK